MTKKTKNNLQEKADAQLFADIKRGIRKYKSADKAGARQAVLTSKLDFNELNKYPLSEALREYGLTVSIEHVCDSAIPYYNLTITW